MIGNGFSRGGVSGLNFTAGTGVTITVDALFSDSVALTTISVADDAKVGARNVTASRDDGSVATCVGCLVVLRGLTANAGIWRPPRRRGPVRRAGRFVRRDF